MTLTSLPAVLAVGSGGLIGLVLGLVGGGGSILAVPLLVYVVGVSSPHVAIGTGDIAVAVNAAFGLAAHARLGTVKWRCALVFAASGIAGSALGAAAGKAVDGQQLLAVFGLLIIAVTVLAAVLAQWITPFPPDQQFFDGLTLEGAPLPPGGKFLLGSDLLGRDLLSRIIFGAQTSLIIGVVANGSRCSSAR